MAAASKSDWTNASTPTSKVGGSHTQLQRCDQEPTLEPSASPAAETAQDATSAACMRSSKIEKVSDPLGCRGENGNTMQYRKLRWIGIGLIRFIFPLDIVNMFSLLRTRGLFNASARAPRSNGLNSYEQYGVTVRDWP